MKKILYGTLQVIIFFLSYELITTIVVCLIALLNEVLCYIPVLKYLCTFSRLWEGIYFTFSPIISGTLIIRVMKMLTKKKQIYLGSAIAMYSLMAYDIITRFFDAVYEFGFFTENTLCHIWYDAILCVIIGEGIWELTNCKISVKNNEKQITEI